MADTQLGKDKPFWNSSPENINYDKIYVMSFFMEFNGFIWFIVLNAIYQLYHGDQF